MQLPPLSFKNPSATLFSIVPFWMTTKQLAENEITFQKETFTSVSNKNWQPANARVILILIHLTWPVEQTNNNLIRCWDKGLSKPPPWKLKYGIQKAKKKDMMVNNITTFCPQLYYFFFCERVLMDVLSLCCRIIQTCIKLYICKILFLNLADCTVTQDIK